MNTIQEIKCPWCEKVSNIDKPNLKFCPYCGRPTGRISEPKLTYSSTSTEVPKVELKDGDSFSIRFDHLSGDSVTIICDISNTKNIRFKDKKNIDTTISRVQSDRQVAGNFEFCLKDYTKEETGYLIFKYNNANRNQNKIWQETDNWTDEERFELKGKILIASKEWIPESEFLFFSKEIQKQKICIYNPSITERKFEFESPNGYSIYPYSEKYFGKSFVPIQGNHSEILCIDKEKQKSEENPIKWKVGNNEVELFELPVQTKTNIQKSKLKISFDLGARKISIRALWRGFAPLDKKIGEIDEIGGTSFPPTMLFDIDEKEKYFFEEAENLKNKKVHLKEIIGLKTCLRDFNDTYTKYNANWTNKYLLSLMFSKISEKIRQWISELFKSKNKTVPNNFNEYFNNPEYIFSYPILNTKEKTEEYKNILKETFINSFDEKIEDSQIKFISEPDAVLNYIISKKQNIKLNEGELFAVIDSGAGTTDISVGKIERKDSNLYLSDLKSLTLNLNENQKKNYELPINRNEIHIGGVLIDRILSYVLETNASSILNSPNARNYVNYWNARAEKNFSTLEKIELSKRIKERISEDKEAKLQVNNFNFDINDKPSINHSHFGEKVIEPIIKEPLIEANDKLLSYGINLKNISTIIMIGGSNICQYMRYYTVKNLPLYTNLVKKNDDQLTKEDRLNAVVEGTILEIDNIAKKSFATFIIKDEYEKIEKTIIKEGEIITPRTFPPILLKPDEDIVILNLYAKSELWNNELKKIASARCNAINFNSNAYGDEVNFEISISEKNCRCDISAGEYSAIGWDINFA